MKAIKSLAGANRTFLIPGELIDVFRSMGEDLVTLKNKANELVDEVNKLKEEVRSLKNQTNRV